MYGFASFSVCCWTVAGIESECLRDIANTFFVERQIDAICFQELSNASMLDQWTFDEFRVVLSSPYGARKRSAVALNNNSNNNNNILNSSNCPHGVIVETHNSQIASLHLPSNASDSDFTWAVNQTTKMMRIHLRKAQQPKPIISGGDFNTYLQYEIEPYTKMCHVEVVQDYQSKKTFRTDLINQISL